jgi:hypothetical protein
MPGMRAESWPMQPHINHAHQLAATTCSTCVTASAPAPSWDWRNTETEYVPWALLPQESQTQYLGECDASFGEICNSLQNPLPLIPDQLRPSLLANKDQLVFLVSSICNISGISLTSSRRIHWDCTRRSPILIMYTDSISQHV